LKSNYAGELASQVDWNPEITQEQIDEAMDVIQPEIDPEVLRKYVAYARKNVYPTLTDPVKERLKNYYVNLRLQGVDSNKPVPVTARQLEALVRLSEASARLRLSNEVSMQDAERAIRISYECLKKVGVDPETGFLDADIIATGVSKTIRDKTKVVMDIIRDLSKENQGVSPMDDVIARAEAEGIDRSKAEEIVTRLKRDGSIMEPKHGLLRLV
jgi:replicative DNA helicase Mcm